MKNPLITLGRTTASIRRQLLVSLMLALLAGTLLVSIVAAYGTLDELDELFDTQLRQVAELVQEQEDALHIAHVSGIKGPAFPPGAELLHRVKGEKQFLIQIWDADGSLLYSSHPAIHFPDLHASGDKDFYFEKDNWSSYSVRTREDTVQVSQPDRGRTHIAIEIAGKIVLPVLLQFPLLGLFAWVAVRRGLKPLQAVSFAIRQRAPGSLEPIDSADVPEEILPLVDALNGLLRRLDAALAAERRFIADAAHELRTPLTAIQLQLQLLVRAQTPPARAEAEEALSRGISRCIRLVQQLLTFSRVEPESPVRVAAPVALARLAAESLEQFALIAAEKDVTLAAGGMAPASVSGFADTLQILLNNLVDNAIRYTPGGGRVEVSVALDGAGAVLSVADSGIGIPPESRARVFDRFVRLEGQGTGLGLAIVREVAQQHGARLSVENGLGGAGTAIRLRFPAVLP